MPIIRKDGDYKLKKERLEIDTDTPNVLALDSELDDLILDVAQFESFETGTEAIFYQVSAPTGWTTSLSDFEGSTIRIINDGTGSPSGGGSGGTHDIDSPPNTNHDHGNAENESLTSSQGPYHSHAIRGDDDYQGNLATPPVRGTVFNTSNMYTDYIGGGSHNHSFAADSSVTPFAPKYIEVIVAIKD